MRAAYGQSYILDPTFGTAGKTTIVFPTAANTDVVTSLALLPGSKLLVAGENNKMFGLAQLTATGQPDLTFGTGGTTTTSFTSNSPSFTVSSAQATAPLLQPDGNILVGGQLATMLTSPSTTGPAKKACARFQPSGALDNSFGTSGRLLNDANTGSLNTYVNALALQADGKFFSINYRLNVGGNIELTTIERISAAGTYDNSFVHNYPVTGNETSNTTSGSRKIAYTALVDNAGRLLTAGEHLVSNQNYVGPNGAAIVRYLGTGQPDPGFGTNGITILNASAGGQRIAWRKMLLQSDNKIVVAGLDRNDSIAIARFTADGVLDTSFGKKGLLKAATGSTTNAVLGLDVLATGEVLAGLRTATNDCRIFRFSATAPTFTTSTIALPGFSPVAMALQPNGRVVIAGTQTDGSGNKSFGVAGLVYSPTLSSRAPLTGSLTLYPNPAAQTLTLHFPELSETQLLKLQVFDLLGREVLTLPAVRAGGEVRIPLQTVRPGSYTLRIEGPDFIFTRHFVRAE
ncbi:putative delta-60 repeat protein/predicted secreted protein (Por secretion system target) [Hymenobacter chitinivorans DSM 11115]|uniref:Putative delta-60 repeat protein/predicted secreted protein (Por secretion system target) n=2 Tax=Hymenobacter chitinivorans TaxID=89969 RepID=A0A2M9AST2_9BACT|nr:putative delta-60 repeat protein/predicted secreted protein (Por secretion system target) [Hymenobacter chitinivorans DSM 11115]